MDKKFCFKVRVAFNYKVPNNTKTFSNTSKYYIVTDSVDDAMDTAIYLNKTEYGNTIEYQYKGCAVICKRLVYVLNK